MLYSFIVLNGIVNIIIVKARLSIFYNNKGLLRREGKSISLIDIHRYHNEYSFKSSSKTRSINTCNTKHNDPVAV